MIKKLTKLKMLVKEEVEDEDNTEKLPHKCINRSKYNKREDIYEEVESNI